MVGKESAIKGVCNCMYLSISHFTLCNRWKWALKMEACDFVYLESSVLTVVLTYLK